MRTISTQNKHRLLSLKNGNSDAYFAFDASKKYLLQKLACPPE
ncbi:MULTISPECIES: hypothetical protein [Sphingobacterium]|nr:MULTISPECIES: hypothetical protein [Sphingobacterium]